MIRLVLLGYEKQGLWFFIHLAFFKIQKDVEPGNRTFDLVAGISRVGRNILMVRGRLNVDWKFSLGLQEIARI